ncbi:MULTISPECIES: 16S rRNA (guanine(966)-N(2))-methyltransferase RsmD [Rhodanobacter]|uniref:16S rRNA (guanine(966)-N(2))-methyltransferase RsmD n=1 Tax=Rhodanobacter TaxID=75309 RepID=UPI000260E631|nr:MULTISPECIES: 16S rRNA (guanine(966)-N(2))-methyltransferase RsmD [Rhodanobacter]EIM01804.1 RsmD family RNA methyltransferase [Rhodanobacter denitrificans]KZC19635.1 16S rRNA (guanine(966)-N(2))-methyltransferase RsmD [Rhodanobacter denitrificans]UJM91465.1 16S rRNA (guanine(966)-N(2))-methyltransferase RsmD [Rhodanobacter denitrificans]UJM92929.1 16S rRNA (guanine(966)-N(2))-methyltransferase RsmD [Rhodanobacter denitrificans]UJM96459.1 16S rRNA (guanine(966)-N(2))-methyltransferase RsmD [
MNDMRRAAPGRIRIIGGSLRNSRLEVPNLPGLRPTAERVRETLFNWLAPVIDGARCLDLCAGTGALGIEALSRGAAAVQFVERDARAAQALRANLARLKADGGQVAALEAEAFLRGTAQPCDLVFLDPPFALELWPALARQLEQGGWLAARAWIYVESPRGPAPALPPNWQLHREGQAGEVRFALYRRALPLS